MLRRPYRDIDLVYPKRPERLPVILSEEEVARLIESAATSYHRVILMTLHGAGLRREELCRLKVTDIDSQRMVLHVKAKVIRIATLLCHRDCWKSYAITGSGGNPRRICFPVTIANGANNRSVQKRCTTRFAKQRGVRESRKRCIRICHSWTTHLLERGTDLKTIQMLLGHFDLEATTNYLRLSQRHLQSINNPIGALPISGLGDKPTLRPRKNQ